MINLFFLQNFTTKWAINFKILFFCIFCNFANSKRMCSSISASFYLANLISNIVNIITIYNCWHTPDLSVYILIRIQFICGSYFGKWWLVYPLHFYQYTIKYQSVNASVAQWGARQSHNLRVVCSNHTWGTFFSKQWRAFFVENQASLCNIGQFEKKW